MGAAASEEGRARPGFAGDRIERQLGAVVDSIKRLLEQEHAGELVGQG